MTHRHHRPSNIYRDEIYPPNRLIVRHISDIGRVHRIAFIKELDSKVYHTSFKVVSACDLLGLNGI